MHALIGDDSPLWLIQPRIALTLWISLPSPDARVALLRRSLVELVGIPPISFSVSSALHVLPIGSFVPPLPIGSVYVGIGNEAFGLKPLCG